KTSTGADELSEHLVVDGDAVPSNAGAPTCLYQCLACLSDSRNPSDYPGHLLSCRRLLIGMGATSPLSRLLTVDVAICFCPAEQCLQTVMLKASRNRFSIRGSHFDSPQISLCRNTNRASCGVDSRELSPGRPTTIESDSVTGRLNCGAETVAVA